MWHVWGREELHGRYCWENLKKRYRFEDLEEERETIIEWIFKK
jgi:hypothetical protein